MNRVVRFGRVNVMGNPMIQLEEEISSEDCQTHATILLSPAEVMELAGFVESGCSYAEVEE